MARGGPESFRKASSETHATWRRIERRRPAEIRRLAMTEKPGGAAVAHGGSGSSSISAVGPSSECLLTPAAAACFAPSEEEEEDA